MDKRRIRVLHVTGGMNCGGVETWLVHVLRHIDRSRFCMDVVSSAGAPCYYDKDVKALGSRIIHCAGARRPGTYARNFRRILREQGPYQVVHSHVHHYSGFIMRLAQQEGIPVRIAHSHNAPSDGGERVGIARRAYIALMRREIWRHSTLGLADSKTAARDLYGRRWMDDGRWRTLWLGIDLEPSRQAVEPAVVRNELGIPPDALVIGHAGRFAAQKNHRFLVEIVAEAVKRDPRVWALLLGEGSLRAEIERQVTDLGLEDRVVFGGVRSDLARVMAAAMDVFLLPSRHEAFGLVLAQAQAIGLPCIFSDVVAEEADIVEPLVQRMSLSKPAWAWAEAALRTMERGRVLGQMEACALVEQTPINITNCVAELERIYCESCDDKSGSAFEF